MNKNIMDARYGFFSADTWNDLYLPFMSDIDE